MPQDNSGRNAIRHFSGRTHCARRGATALISAVAREEGTLRVCSVLWCSLRGDSQWCSEDCLTTFADADRPPP